ncbi:hypothetical protein F2P81_023472 [Scophthalmus maximus]|uniref:3-hydroxyisobutyrate dehydrogenase n=1 Tax=Scophthalmus maximus TaxID=52904 RepID=A0A6A4RZ95_SCOMX|nr:hypothetical protein F2P81_023472 [Scophthalmus maximus]
MTWAKLDVSMMLTLLPGDESTTWNDDIVSCCASKQQQECGQALSFFGKKKEALRLLPLKTHKVFLEEDKNGQENDYECGTFPVSMRSMASKTPVGFIGLGNMGSPMAKNLLKNGYPVIATDVFPESCKELQDLGAQVLDSPADVAEKADRIITMLPSSPNVIEVYTGPNGILKKVKKGTLLIDSSTIDPSVSKEMAVAAEKMGAVFMDAPVSGGGVEEEYNAAQELLTCMGANVVYCGQVGTGQAAKICNNMLLAIGMIGTAETMNLGIRLGLDPKLLAKILNMSSGRCWSSDTYNPVPGVMDGVPSANNYQGGFGTTLMAKCPARSLTRLTSLKVYPPPRIVYDVCVKLHLVLSDIDPLLSKW